MGGLVWFGRMVDEAGLRDKPIETLIDFIDYDEGCDPAATRPRIA